MSTPFMAQEVIDAYDRKFSLFETGKADPKVPKLPEAWSHTLQSLVATPSDRICRYCGIRDDHVANWFFMTPFDACCGECTRRLPGHLVSRQRPLDYYLSEEEATRILYWGDPRPWENSYNEKLALYISASLSDCCESCGIVLDMSTGRDGNICLMCRFGIVLQEVVNKRCVNCGKEYTHLELPGVYSGCKECLKEATTAD